MRSAILIAAALTVGSPAAAQLADRLSRGVEPNAIDRALGSDRGGAAASDAAAADRRRAQEAARDAAARRTPPPTSTLVDGPNGVQRLGGGVTPPAAPPASLPGPQR
ncbi:hypothetical protein [Sphingomonas dokdonensis]|uniref:Uncharacterized protein n=1 Tax=Sphingomonas dokdonensis TaxID=344880 RepID=A0A245ZK05_9SPHN|nr:hypothetical protein [Sphingomonas dokdonensis]OWK30080.1 hypothetical protein SPDO_17610 [Sphingomonas dokdonensis]